MAGPRTGDDIRDRLRLPIAFGVFAIWCAAGVTALVRTDAQVFIIASGPFTILCGYLFTDGLFRRAQNGRSSNGG